MYTDTMTLGLDGMGEIIGSRLDAHQQYSLIRCIELAKLGEYSLVDFMDKFIEDKHPELRDYVIRTWYLV